MIADVSFWKGELFEIQGRLEMAVGEMDSVEMDSENDNSFENIGRQNFELERALFFSALAIRRIFEADAFTRANNPNALEWEARTISRNLKSKSFRLPVLDGNQQYEQLTILKIAKELVHSHCLSWSEASAGTLDGFWLASENNETKRIFLVKWTLFCSILTMIISDQSDPFKDL